MTIRVKQTGRVFTDAHWFGLNWIRAAEGRDGWYHFFISDVDILVEGIGEDLLALLLLGAWYVFMAIAPMLVLYALVRFVHWAWY